eukprot:scaffold173265_cov31-Tisochrysis_lutea.AAC.3
MRWLGEERAAERADGVARSWLELAEPMALCCSREGKEGRGGERREGAGGTLVSACALGLCLLSLFSLLSASLYVSVALDRWRSRTQSRSLSRLPERLRALSPCFPSPLLHIDRLLSRCLSASGRLSRSVSLITGPAR